jgi:hypothetical protein
VDKGREQGTEQPERGQPDTNIIDEQRPHKVLPYDAPAATLAPLSEKPLADSRCPLIENCPGFRLLETLIALNWPPEKLPLVLTGVTPAWIVSKSV